VQTRGQANKNENAGNGLKLIKSFTGNQLSGFHNPVVSIYKNTLTTKY